MTKKPTIYTVTVSAQALHQLDEACAYIHSQGAPLAAQGMAAKLLTAIETLEQHPQRGRRVSQDLYELLAVRPYVIRYRIRSSTVEVVRIRHAAQRPS